MSKRYNTPHRTHTIKTHMTEEEHADLPYTSKRAGFF